MIEKSPTFDHELFARLYNSLIKLKDDEEFQGHEWVDIDEVILNNQKKDRIDKK